VQKLLKKLAKFKILKPIVDHLVRGAASSKAGRIAKHFAKFLSPVLALIQDKKNECFKIRHMVYCEELAFEDVKEDGLECDEVDQHSLHCLMEHKPTSRYAGTVRVVCSSNENEQLPLEKYCLSTISADEVKPTDYARDKICEISRLAVPGEFRRRNTDKFKGAATGAINETVYSEEELRCFPFIAVGLYLSAANIVIQNKIEHCFVMMEPRLARSLGFVGIKFRQIGPVVEYHGKRAPYYITPTMLRSSLPKGFKRLLKHIDSSLAKQFADIEKLLASASMSDQEFITHCLAIWQQVEGNHFTVECIKPMNFRCNIHQTRLNPLLINNSLAPVY
jgi:N-acyl amino acid synthase of PEP-CTERM/exosortase system